MKTSGNILIIINDGRASVSILSERSNGGGSFKSILKYLPELAKVFSAKKEITNHEFKSIMKQFSGKGKGMGLSTFTKFLYFFNFKLDGLKCLTFGVQ